MDHRDGKACSDTSACKVRIQALAGMADTAALADTAVSADTAAWEDTADPVGTAVWEDTADPVGTAVWDPGPVFYAPARLLSIQMLHIFLSHTENP